MKQAEDELTAAAERIREIAKATVPGPWRVSHSGLDVVADDADITVMENFDDPGPWHRALPYHVALLDPPTALLVAELLEGEAARWKPRPVDDLATYLMSPACKLARHILEKTP